jgi:ubiquinone/menaquinone biosynthesis C-methylase UbiE
MSPNSPSSTDFKETLRQEWLSAAPYWKKWNQKLALQSQAATDMVIQGAALAPGMQVLDLASGTGQPALTIAQAIAPTGRVVATDLTPAMLEAAKENAQEQGLSNFEIRVADAEHLPFPNAVFDRVTCRFGIMFFPEIQTALAEIRRVLKPGGRVAFLVWGPLEENPLFAATIVPFMKHVNIPQPTPDAPTIFRFADPAKLASTLTAAGFRDIATTKRHIPWPWPGAPQDAWEGMREIAAPFKKIMAAVPPEKVPEVMKEVMDNLHRHYDGKQVNFSATVVLATGAI